MHANDLVELAAAISAEGPSLLTEPGAVSMVGLAPYWASSKCRLLRWSRRLKSFRERLIVQPPANSLPWRAALPVCREVLASEILTRVGAGFWAAFDRNRGSREAEPLARSIWVGHLEARHRVLNLLACGNRLPSAEASALDRLRRAAERWSDLLLAPFMALADVSDLAHDPLRLADFAQDAADDRQSPTAGKSQRLRSASRIEAFVSCRRLATFNADLNAQIAASIMSCFSLDGFDETLTPGLSAFSHSLLCERLTTVAADAELWIADLLEQGTGIRGQGPGDAQADCCT
jgi:hypothetical protein